MDPRIHGTDPDLLDTATSPPKLRREHMELEREARKRLNMDIAGDEGMHTSNRPKTLLAITDGKGKDGEEATSPSSSTSSSKRAKLSQDHTTNEISAASLEEDRRTQ